MWWVCSVTTVWSIPEVSFSQWALYKFSFLYLYLFIYFFKLLVIQCKMLSYYFDSLLVPCCWYLLQIQFYCWLLCTLQVTILLLLFTQMLLMLCRLQHLPVELGLCNLKAIWLSENQAQSMLKFQEDVDEETGRTVLTCFLLPQQAYHTESMGIYSPLSEWFFFKYFFSLSPSVTAEQWHLC